MTDVQLQWALREWAMVCTALASGMAMAIARKGGIHEPRGGLFPLPGSSIPGQQQHLPRHFALLASHEHQERTRLATWCRDTSQAEICHSHTSEATLCLPAWAEVVGCWLVQEQAKVEAAAALAGCLPLAAEELMMRYQYRNQPWLAVLSLRVWRWPKPRYLSDRPSYHGCRSWIPLQAALAGDHALPALADSQWQRQHEQLAQALSGAHYFDCSI